MRDLQALMKRQQSPSVADFGCSLFGQANPDFCYCRTSALLDVAIESFLQFWCRLIMGTLFIP
jgi:hypothetical protein